MLLPDRSDPSSTRRRQCRDRHRTGCPCRHHRSRSSPRRAEDSRSPVSDFVPLPRQVARSRTTGRAHPTRHRMPCRGCEGPRGEWCRAPIPICRSLPPPHLIEVASRHPPTTELPIPSVRRGQSAMRRCAVTGVSGRLGSGTSAHLVRRPAMAALFRSPEPRLVLCDEVWRFVGCPR